MKGPNDTFKLMTAVLAAASMTLAGCAAHNQTVWEEPKLLKPSPTQNKLAMLPAPLQRVPVAVYGFTDQTGQFKQSENTQSLSRAVTQGATSILIKALQDSGQRGWFQVIERERLDNVLRERAVIREMRANYLGEKKVNPNALPPLLFAGVLLEGGIIGYDSNTKSGGVGARFLGIGAHTQYREDTITLFLRAVSVKTGEVLATVSVRKSIASVSVGADAFRYVAFKDLLEAEAGFAYNEPDQLALQNAIEKAVHSLIMEGAVQNLWCFNTSDEYARGLVRTYLAERNSIKEDKVQLPSDPWNPACQKTVARAPAAPVPGAKPAVRIADALLPIAQAPNAVSSSTAPSNARLPGIPVQLPAATRPPTARAAPLVKVEPPKASAVQPPVTAKPTTVGASTSASASAFSPPTLAATAVPRAPTPLTPEPDSQSKAQAALLPPTPDGARPALQIPKKDKPIEPANGGNQPSLEGVR